MISQILDPKCSLKVQGAKELVHYFVELFGFLFECKVTNNHNFHSFFSSTSKNCSFFLTCKFLERRLNQLSKWFLSCICIRTLSCPRPYHFGNPETYCICIGILSHQKSVNWKAKVRKRFVKLLRIFIWKIKTVFLQHQIINFYKAKAKRGHCGLMVIASD